MIYTIRTTVGRENSVVETVSSKAKNMATDIKAILHPEEIKGYIFIEGGESAIERTISGVPHVRGIIKKEVPMKDLQRFLEVRKVEIKISRGDIVEITGGPFKNEKGKVTRVDESKEEVTVELLEAAIPIPITVPIESVKLLEADKSG